MPGVSSENCLLQANNCLHQSRSKSTKVFLSSTSFALISHKRSAYQNMSSPSGGPTEYDLPDQLPADLEEHVEGASGLRRATGWLVLERHALKSRASGKTWAFYLFSTREQLHAQFYPLSNGTTGKGLGVIVVNGPSLARPVIIGRSPSGKRLHYWVWQGPRLEFADDEWEIVKTLGTLDSETKTLEDWDQDDDDEEDTNVAGETKMIVG